MIQEVPSYKPQSCEYTVYPGGNAAQKYCSLKYHPGNAHDETLRRKTFQFPDPHELAQARLVKDQGLEGAIKYFRKNGVREIELVTLNYSTVDGPGSIQVLYAEPPGKTLAPLSVDIFLHGRNASIGYLSVPAIQSYFNGKAICMLSYRGEEGNKGTPYQEALADDLDACIEFLTKHKKWETERINFIASSLGCDVLANMFYRRCKLYNKKEEKFGDAKLIAPFSSLKDMAKLSIGRYRIIPRKVEPTYPGLLYPLRNIITRLFKNPILSLYDHLPYLSTKIHSVKIFASKQDEYIPIQQSRKVYGLIKHLMGKEHASMKEFPDLNHSELCQSVT